MTAGHRSVCQGQTGPAPSQPRHCGPSLGPRGTGLQPFREWPWGHVLQDRKADKHLLLQGVPGCWPSTHGSGSRRGPSGEQPPHITPAAPRHGGHSEQTHSPAGHHRLAGQGGREHPREQGPPRRAPSRGALKGSGRGHSPPSCQVEDAEKMGLSPLRQDPNIYGPLRPAGWREWQRRSCPAGEAPAFPGRPVHSPRGGQRAAGSRHSSRLAVAFRPQPALADTKRARLAAQHQPVWVAR